MDKQQQSKRKQQTKRRQQKGGYINAYTSAKLPKSKNKSYKGSRRTGKSRRRITVRRSRNLPLIVVKKEITV